MSKSHKVLDTPKMKPLKKIIENNFYDVMKEVYHYNTKFKMTTSWLVISNKQEQSQYHNHNNVCLVVFYIYKLERIQVKLVLLIMKTKDLI